MQFLVDLLPFLNVHIVLYQSLILYRPDRGDPAAV